jgi:hypothetical protein
MLQVRLPMVLGEARLWIQPFEQNRSRHAEAQQVSVVGVSREIWHVQ